MIKVPRSQSTSIKNMIYPEPKKMNKNVHRSNIDALRKQQMENKHKKEEKENFVPPEPYKMKEFKNVESKLGKVAVKMNNNLQGNYNTERKGSFQQPAHIKTTSNMVKTKTMMDKSKSSSLLKAPVNVNVNVKSKKSDSVKVMPKQVDHNSDEENIFALGNLEEGLREEYNNLQKMIQKSDNVQVNSNTQKISKKGPTPKATEVNKLAPKVLKDHISENKQKVIQNEVPIKVIKKEEPESVIHKDFGKTPDYLRKYKQDAEDKKEFEKRLAEEAKYPKGTRLLSEDERVETLNSLAESRKEIITLLEKMPISMRTMSLQNRKTELENKLSEIETAIKTFSRKQVFIKVDS